MNLKKIILGVALLMGATSVAHADKGMWLLNELNQQNIERMRKLGFTLPIDSLYDLNKPSIARAVVIFGNGCTGITVSNEGLIFTNHHCGYSSIQSQSTVNHDYLKDGFVSQSFKDELPIPGLSVKYLRQMKDVTNEVVSQLNGITDEMTRLEKAEEVSAQIAAAAAKDSHTYAIVQPYYANNKYYLLVYDVFNDVRMVFAPPSSIGKFGGDTDNWMWPRQTGDFSVFRVYAGADNKPADYSPNNKPFKPAYYAHISMDGYRPGDYAMTIGFPGSTDRYLTSWGVKNRMEDENDPRIEVRGIKQGIWKKAMLADQATRIKYSSKYAQSANYWKNSIGMNKGLVALNVIGNKQKEEATFEKWVKDNNKTEYTNVLPTLKKVYKESGIAERNFYYFYEALIGGTEIVKITRSCEGLEKVPADKMNVVLLQLQEKLYKDYVPSLDEKVLPAMLAVVKKNLPANELPSIYSVIEKQFKGNFEKYSEYVFSKSIFPYYDKVKALFESHNTKEIEKVLKEDPALKLTNSVIEAYKKLYIQMSQYSADKEWGRRMYFKGRREMDPNALMPSDANFTMRMSYGSINGYSPRDAVEYLYFSTDKGILEKENPNNPEFAVQPDILNLFRTHDYGQYGEGDHINVAFLSNNDITGGNSGSPVFDKNGRLIGLAFDGNWEAMSGDIEFEPNLQRTICVDIRYVLFVIDKWGKCNRLIKELTLMKDAPAACPTSAKGCCGKSECQKIETGVCHCKNCDHGASSKSCEMNNIKANCKKSCDTKGCKTSCDKACKKACKTSRKKVCKKQYCKH